MGTTAEQDAALARIADGARALRVGAGLDEATDVCPVVSPQSRERLEDEIELAAQDGARVVLDGRGRRRPRRLRARPDDPRPHRP